MKSGNGYTYWTHESVAADGTVTKTHVAAEWTGDHGDVYVRLTDESGVETLRKGEMTIERAAISKTIFFVSVKSLFGDVTGTGRTMKGAAQDYASKVLRVEADRVARENSIEEQAAIARCYAEAIVALLGVEPEIVAQLQVKLDRAMARRDHLRTLKIATVAS